MATNILPALAYYHLGEIILTFGILLPQSLVSLFLWWHKKSLRLFFYHSLIVTLASSLLIHTFILTKHFLITFFQFPIIYGLGATLQLLIYIFIPFLPLLISKDLNRKQSWLFHFAASYIWYLLIAIFLIFSLVTEVKIIFQTNPTGIINLISPLRVFDFLPS